MNGSAITTARKRKSAPCPHCGRAEFRKNFTDRRYIAILMNKYIFSKVFADFYGRRCVQASDVDAALLESLAGDCGKVVYKPNCKGQARACASSRR